MPNLIILSREADEYRALIEKANLPGLNLVTDYAQGEIVLGEPKAVRDALPRLSQVKWVQAIYAGVEPLVDPSGRHDYVLTNARSVFGGLMSEYVFGYLLFLEKRMLDRIQAQQAREWRRTEPGVCAARPSACSGLVPSARTWQKQPNTLR